MGPSQKVGETGRDEGGEMSPSNISKCQRSHREAKIWKLQTTTYTSRQCAGRNPEASQDDTRNC